LDPYKERLIAKGYTHTYSVDYEETPMAKMNMIKGHPFIGNALLLGVTIV